MHNSVLGLDEACTMADAGGNTKIIGAADRKKHEKILAERSVEIHILHGAWILYLYCSSHI